MPTKSSGLPTAAWLAIAAGCGVLALSVGGIVAAIVIPNFLDALQKAKQHRTVADLRQLGAALERYAADAAAGAVAEPMTPGTTAAELGGHLASYLAAVPPVDGWKRPYRFACASRAGGGSCDTFCVGSGGRDGVFEMVDLHAYAEAPEGFAPGQYDRDLVWCGGAFVRWPEYPAAP
jgi:type II secretory pathway pseudopilin PulG